MVTTNPLRWLAVDSTGAIFAELPTLVPTGPLRRTMGQYESQTFTLTLTPDIDPAWFQCTEKGAGALIGYSGAPGSEHVEWGGIVVSRQRDLTNVVQLSAATPEWYFLGRFTGDYSQTSRDQNLIVSDMVAKAAAGDARVSGSVGWPFSTTVVGAAGVARQRTYKDADDKSVYSALTELGQVQGGPQWLTGWAWTHGPERIRPMLSVGTRLGTVAPTGLAPSVALDPILMRSGSLTESYANGSGANLIMAVSSGAGTTRPQQSSGLLQPNRPLYEYRFTPSTSITNLPTLLAHAQEQEVIMANGLQTITMELDRSTAPQLGVSWDLGDDVQVQLTGVAFPVPVTAVGQLIGYEVTADTITPFISLPGGF